MILIKKLDLDMVNKVLTVFFIATLLISCNNPDEVSPYEDLLTRPPYAALTDSIHHDSKNAQLYYSRGILLNKNNVPTAALADFKKAWELEKREQYAVSVSSLLLSKPDSAISFIQTALKDFPKSIALQLNLAQAYKNGGKEDDALNVCEQLISQQPNQLDALEMKAEFLKDKNDIEGSIHTLEKAYSIAPLDEQVAFNLAYTYAQTKNPKILVLCDSLISRNSKKPEPYYFKGIYFENTGNDAKAINLFDQAITHDYTFLDAYMDKGEIFYNQKKYNEAIKIFNLALHVSTTYADAYYWLGKCQEALGQKEDARLNYQRAYGLDKSFTDAKEAADRLSGR
jgi:tetratricopeptide (TPR) repeat protein